MQIFIFLSLGSIVLYGFYLWQKKSKSIKIKHYKIFENKTIKKFSLLQEQGHCNINYLIQTEDKNYLLRKFKHDNNRKKEFYIQNLVHKKNIAAKAIILDKENDLMICDFIEGEHKEKLSQQNLKELARILRKLHRIKVPLRAYNFRNNFKPKERKAQEAFKVIDTFKPEYVLGHNDLHSKNILFGKKIQFIDWEYAGKTDRYFDLAAIIVEYKLNKKDERTFLRSYFGREKQANLKKLKAFKIIYRTLWTVWFGQLERGEIATVSH